MTQIVLPDPGTPFGERVAGRLATAQVIWLTTIGKDGTPQPNPVWFLWTDEGVLTYNRPDANRITHIADRPRVALNLDGKGDGSDIIVLTGTARRLDGHPARPRTGRLPCQVPGRDDPRQWQRRGVRYGLSGADPDRDQQGTRVLIRRLY